MFGLVGIGLGILLALLFIVPMVFSIDPLGMYFDATAERLFDMVMPTLYVYL